MGTRIASELAGGAVGCARWGVDLHRLLFRALGRDQDGAAPCSQCTSSADAVRGGDARVDDSLERAVPPGPERARGTPRTTLRV